MRSIGGGSHNPSHHRGVSLTLNEAQGRCTDSIAAALQADRPTLLEALPGLGKSHGAVLATARTGIPVSILTNRGREEQYEVLSGWCEKEGLTFRVLPAATEECPLLDENDDAHQKYNSGATVRELHQHYGERQDCTHADAWDFDADEIDVLIGHPRHANVPKVRDGRVLVFDEFPEEVFIQTVEPKAVSQFLDDTSEIPFKNYTNLIEGRSLEEPRREALQGFEGKGLNLRDGEGVLNDESGEYHAYAPEAVLALLLADDLRNGWEHAVLAEGRFAAHDQENTQVILLHPPNFAGAEGVIGLDGTPTRRLWELAIGVPFSHERVLSGAERRAYVTNAQNLRVVNTNEDILTYSSGTYAKPDRDAALLEEATRLHGVSPGVITSSSALQALEERVKVSGTSSAYYGNFKGSNSLADKAVGVILGSPHFGDQFVAQWAALAGEPVNTDRKPGESYGEFGDRVLRHMREHEVLQAMFRFSRQGEGATVYVHTGALPDWVPLAAGPEECSVKKRSPGERAFLAALSDLEPARASEVVAGMEESVTTRWVRQIGNRLANEGVVQKWDDPSHSQASLYELTGEYNPHGQVELPEVASGNPELSRMETLYGALPGFEEDRPWWQQDGWREELESLQDGRRRQRRQIETAIWRNEGILP